MSTDLFIFSSLAQDYEFTGFSFGGRHSSEYGLTAAVSSNFYEEPLFAEFTDNVLDVPGKEGSYYFSTELKTKTLTIYTVFDNLTSKNLRDIKLWLNPKTIGELIFDETPYKYNLCKISSVPQFSFVPFETEITGGLQHIFKGSLSLTFLAFEPYAYSKYLEVAAVPIWNGTTWVYPYSEIVIPGWYEESGLYLEIPALTATANATNGHTIATPIAANTVFGYNYYNGGMVESLLKITMTIPNLAIDQSIRITNNTNTKYFELHSLRNIGALVNNSAAWTIVCNPKTHLFTSTIGGVTYNLDAISTGNFIGMSVGNNVLHTSKEITTINCAFDFKYL